MKSTDDSHSFWQRARSNLWFKYLGVLLALGLVALLGRQLVSLDNVVGLINDLRELGLWGYLFYFLIYVVLATLLFPVTPLNLLAGILFPFHFAVPIALVSANVSATLSFLIARYFARNAVERRVRRIAGAEQILRLVENESKKLIILTRLNPFIPSAMKNYGFGVTAIPLGTYIFLTLLGQLPIVLLHTYLGWAGGIAMMNEERQPAEVQLMVIGGGVLLSLVLIVVITFYGRRWLKRQEVVVSK